MESPTTPKIPVWLDCDPGHDDAMAIILAGYHPKLHLLGISTVAGNQTVQKTTKNALDVLELAGLNHINVVAGSAVPIIRKTIIAVDIHGDSGIDGATLPCSQRQPLRKNAILHMYETISQHPSKVTVIATGMLTNVALLIRTFPEVMDNIEEVVLMGGSIAMGNISPSAEFNSFIDPEAADIVYNSGLKVAMVPLDVTHTVLCTKEVVKQFIDMDTRLTRDIAGFLMFFADMYFTKYKMVGAPLHDPCAVAYVIDRGMFEAEKYTVQVEKGSQFCDGRTVVDFYSVTKLPKNVTVCTKVDVDGFWNLMINAVKAANAKSVYGLGVDVTNKTAAINETPVSPMDIVESA